MVVGLFENLCPQCLFISPGFPLSGSGFSVSQDSLACSGQVCSKCVRGPQLFFFFLLCWTHCEREDEGWGCSFAFLFILDYSDSF